MTPSVSAAPSTSIAPDAAPFEEPSSAERAKRLPFQFDGRYIAPLFITLVLIVAQWQFAVLESFPKTLLAIGASIGAEILFSMLTRGTMPHLASAYVSGISVGILVRSTEWWPYALCATIAIASKYVVRWKGRHLWNPSNFAIAAMLLLAPAAVSTLSQQWDNRPYAMFVIWTLGSVILWRLKRFHICAAYVISFVVLAGFRTLITGHGFAGEVAPITGPMYQLFIFFMITDPKTTVRSKKGQILVAVAVAVAECVLRLNENIHAPYFALFLVGPVANFIDIALSSRAAKPQAEPTRAIAA